MACFVDDLDIEGAARFGELFSFDDDFARLGIIFCGDPLLADRYGDGVAVGNSVVLEHQRNPEGGLADTADKHVAPVGESECRSLFVVDVCNVSQFVCRGAAVLALGLLAEDEPVAARFA